MSDMKATFTRTGERRYRVSVEGPNLISSWMEPAAGYDPLMPHDLAHFIVERELGIEGGVFGQLASGGHAGSFHPVDEKSPRKAKRRGNQIAKDNRKDALLSEKAIDLAMRKWKNEIREIDDRDLTSEQIDRICRAFRDISSQWSNLRIGESITLDWHARRIKQRRR